MDPIMKCIGERELVSKVYKSIILMYGNIITKTWNNINIGSLAISVWSTIILSLFTDKWSNISISR